MPLTDCAQAQNESPTTDRSARLIGMAHDARIEERCCLEGILVHEVGPDEAALLLAEVRMVRKDNAHLIRARLKSLEQIAVTSAEVVEDICQLCGDACRVERQNAINNVVCARPVRGIEVPRLSCRLERSHYDARRIWPQMKSLPVKERVLCQGASVVVESQGNGCP